MANTESQTEIHVAQARFLASTDRLLEAAEQARQDREAFFALIRGVKPVRTDAREALPQ